MTVEIAVLVSVVSVAFSIFFGVKNAKRSDDGEIERRTEETTRMNVKLDLISQNTLEIKNDMRNLNDKVEEQARQIVIIDQSTRSAHHRIDGIEERLNKKGGTNEQ